jgi:hypothetical protein
VSSSAAACPKCGAKPKSGGAGWILAVLVLLCLFLVCPYIDTEESAPRPKATVSPEMEEAIQNFLTTGAVHSMNVEFNQVRVDPLIWMGQTLEDKQKFVAIFSNYFDAKGSTGRVNVLSNRNDKKLATYSSWDGINILE